MVIPERTRRVHKLVIPFFFVKLGVVLVSLCSILLLVVGMDYIHVLSRMAENKRLKGENFKLRQEIQQVKNKVDSMEITIERVRNYAKKLQILTGQTDKSSSELPQGSGDEEFEREPASKPDKHSSLMPDDRELDAAMAHTSLEDRVEGLQKASYVTEAGLSRLQVFLLAKTALAAATPSFLPVAGWISSIFGNRRHPYDGVFRMHTGIDIAAEPGTPVRAPAAGLVIFSGNREGYGKVIVIDHGYGIRTLFGHLMTVFVNAGVRVKRGEIISQVGSTGMSTGPHCHYEVRKNGVPVNPATFLSRARF
jgi:murein DD-endopeptidase MepM/ murein hydrolase activator NlpD